jgi:VWFA-related protein
LDDTDSLQMLSDMLGGHTDGGTDAYAHALGALYGMQLSQRSQMTFEALDYLARYLGGIPGRKNLIWFASSFPVTIFPSNAQRQQMSNDRIYASAVKKTADLLTDSKVAVYPINAEGMMTEHVGDSTNWSPGEATAPGARIQSFADPYAKDSGERADTIFSMEQLASDTGGKAFYNTNDLNGAMQHAIDNGSHYYTLVYSPTNKKLDGKYRRIDVKLTDGHYKLAYRRGYNADDSVGTAPSADSDPLRPLLMRGLPSTTQLLYGVRVAPVSPQPAPNATRAGKNPKLTGPVTRYSIDFMIRWTDVALATTDSNTHTGKLQLGLMAYDREGNAVNWIGATQGMNLAPDVFASIQKSGVPGHMEIDLPDKDVYLVTGVYDWNSGKAGTLEIPLHPQTAVQSAAVKPN